MLYVESGAGCEVISPKGHGKQFHNAVEIACDKYF